MNDPQRFEYVVRLGDNALVLGQRLGEWIGNGPELEEEMAMGNFALDYIGQARLFLSYAAELEGAGRDEDQLAFLRDQIDFRNVLLLEQPNGDFGQTIARQFFFESYYVLFLEALTASSDKRLAEVAARGLKESAYHLRHATQWMVRLGDGTEESHQRIQQSVDELWRFTGEMFSGDEIDRWAVDNGVGPDPATLRPAWDTRVNEVLQTATLTRPDNDWMHTGGKQGRHTEHLGYLLTEMQFLQRAYPGAAW
ncbi:MAG: phenylacetate-CoA oxygenase subunit PaaC [Gammaproteobacteria bacterium]|nr:phenylacetate-CoA oxygenase subunit PaaC [Gammaproteobacteria bacterium]